jgi:hypothetical protein
MRPLKQLARFELIGTNTTFMVRKVLALFEAGS